MLKHIKSEEFESEIKEKDIVVVDFFATWCGPCQMLAPVLESLAQNMEKINILKVDVDECPDLAVAFGVQVVPTICFFKNGEKIKTMEGFMTEAELSEIIESL